MSLQICRSFAARIQTLPSSGRPFILPLGILHYVCVGPPAGMTDPLPLQLDFLVTFFRRSDVKLLFTLKIEIQL